MSMTMFYRAKTTDKKGREGEMHFTRVTNVEEEVDDVRKVVQSQFPAVQFTSFTRIEGRLAGGPGGVADLNVRPVLAGSSEGDGDGIVVAGSVPSI